MRRYFFIIGIAGLFAALFFPSTAAAEETQIIKLHDEPLLSMPEEIPDQFKCRYCLS